MTAYVMTKTEIMILAHAEARALVAKKGYSYREALKFGLRRAHGKNTRDIFVAMGLQQPEMPKFMWLRGL